MDKNKENLLWILRILFTFILFVAVYYMASYRCSELAVYPCATVVIIYLFLVIILKPQHLGPVHIVLSAILGLSLLLLYLFIFGAFCPAIPNQCTFPAGFTCIVTKLPAGTSRLYLVVGQWTGHNIQINGINCTQQTDLNAMTSGLYISYNNYNVTGTTKTINMSSGSKAVLADAIGVNPTTNGSPANATNIYCTTSSGEVPSGMKLGSFYNGKIYINYTEMDTNLTKIVVGTYSTRYEQ